MNSRAVAPSLAAQAFLFIVCGMAMGISLGGAIDDIAPGRELCPAIVLSMSLHELTEYRI